MEKIVFNSNCFGDYYPRTLNAMNIVDEISLKYEEEEK